MMTRCPIEEKKFDCARRLFAEFNEEIEAEMVKHDVVTAYSKLMSIDGVGVAE